MKIICYVSICVVHTYIIIRMCVLALVLYIYHIHTIPLLIISGVYVRDGAVYVIYITKHIIIDVHHWNSTFQLTASVYAVLHRLLYVHKTA